MRRKFFFGLLIFFLYYLVKAEEFLCFDDKCSEALSTAKVRISYQRKSYSELNVKRGQKVRIHGKGDKTFLVKDEVDDSFRLLPETVLEIISGVKQAQHFVSSNILFPATKDKQVFCKSLLVSERFLELIYEMRVCFKKNEDSSDMINAIKIDDVGGNDNALIDIPPSGLKPNDFEEIVTKTVVVTEKVEKNVRSSINEEIEQSPLVSINVSETPTLKKEFAVGGYSSNVQKPSTKSFSPSDITLDEVIGLNTSSDETLSTVPAFQTSVGENISKKPFSVSDQDFTGSIETSLSDEDAEIKQVFDFDILREKKKKMRKEEYLQPKKLLKDAVHTVSTTPGDSDAVPENFTPSKFNVNTDDITESVHRHNPSTVETHQPTSSISYNFNGSSVNQKQYFPLNKTESNTTAKTNELISEFEKEDLSLKISDTGVDEFSKPVLKTSNKEASVQASNLKSEGNEISEELPENDSSGSTYTISEVKSEPTAQQTLRVVQEIDEARRLEYSLPYTMRKHENNLHAGHLYDMLEETSHSSEISMEKQDSSFYAEFLEYFHNFSLVFKNMSSTFSYFSMKWLKTRNGSNDNLHCDTESCDDSVSLEMAESLFNVGILNDLPVIESGFARPTYFLPAIVLCVSFFTFAFFSIIRNSKKSYRITSLIHVINQLEKKLLVATKEILFLEEKLMDATMSQASESVLNIQHETGELTQQQIEELQLRNTDLEDKISYLEKELESVSSSALEMHKLLENSLNTQAFSKIAEDEVESLRSLTERQERQIDDLIKEMDSIVIENQCLKEDLKKMEKECDVQIKKNFEISEKNRNLTLRLDRQIEETSSIRNDYKSEIHQLQSKMEDLKINLRRYEFEIEELHRSFMDKYEDKSLDEKQAVQDNMQLGLQISTLKAMNKELIAELKEQKNARHMLDEHIGDIIKECNELKQALELSERERSEAVNKLLVLTDYFNDKESQLQKEIAAKEKLFLENESKDQLLSQKLSSLKEEISNCKKRNEELKKEVHDQEASFKIQLATAEQKSRDFWFAFRQAERKYQESEKEAATLRNRILILETNLSSVNQKLSDESNVNGKIPGQSLIFSPDILPYCSPTDFIPPPPSPIASHSPQFFPPEPSYSSDERLPPLGGRRVPSPPSSLMPLVDDDFKPPLPHAQYMPGRNRHESLAPTYFTDSVQYN